MTSGSQRDTVHFLVQARVFEYERAGDFCLRVPNGNNELLHSSGLLFVLFDEGPRNTVA